MSRRNVPGKAMKTQETRSPMAESKFDKLFANREGAAAPPPALEPPAPPPLAAEPQPRPESRRRAERAAAIPRPIGRPPGKRSDPAWKQFSVLLKIETQREAANILRAKNEGQDFSGLVQGLVENWIKRQQQ